MKIQALLILCSILVLVGCQEPKDGLPSVQNSTVNNSNQTIQENITAPLEEILESNQSNLTVSENSADTQEQLPIYGGRDRVDLYIGDEFIVDGLKIKFLERGRTNYNYAIFEVGGETLRTYAYPFTYRMGTVEFYVWKFYDDGALVVFGKKESSMNYRMCSDGREIHPRYSCDDSTCTTNSDCSNLDCSISGASGTPMCDVGGAIMGRTDMCICAQTGPTA